MPDWIAEDCTTVLMIAILFVGIFGAGAFMLQSRTLTLVASVLAVLAVGLFVTERYVVTNREEVEQFLFKTANAVEFNRHEEVLSSMKMPAKQKAAKEMPNYKFRMCNVTGINELSIDESEDPIKASVTFVVFVDVNAPTYGHDGFGRREVTLFLEKQTSGEWLITGYSHRQPNAGAHL